MFEIEMLPARQGDALWLEYGDAAHPRRALIDAGTPETWDALQARIAALDPGDRHFELLIVSHIDKDHIGGVIPLLEDTALGITFGDVWFNGFRHLPSTSSRWARSRASCSPRCWSTAATTGTTRSTSRPSSSATRDRCPSSSSTAGCS